MKKTCIIAGIAAVSLAAILILALTGSNPLDGYHFQRTFTVKVIGYKPNSATLTIEDLRQQLQEQFASQAEYLGARVDDEPTATRVYEELTVSYLSGTNEINDVTLSLYVGSSDMPVAAVSSKNYSVPKGWRNYLGAHSRYLSDQAMDGLVKMARYKRDHPGEVTWPN